jgi:hypothetical protein
VSSIGVQLRAPTTAAEPGSKKQSKYIEQQGLWSCARSSSVLALFKTDAVPACLEWAGGNE